MSSLSKICGLLTGKCIQTVPEHSNACAPAIVLIKSSVDKSELPFPYDWERRQSLHQLQQAILNTHHSKRHRIEVLYFASATGRRVKQMIRVLKGITNGLFQTCKPSTGRAQLYSLQQHEKMHDSPC